MKPTHRKRIRGRFRRGAALISAFVVMSLLAVGSASYISSSTAAMRQADRQAREIQATHLCEAGIQSVLRSLWRPFKTSQNFTSFDAATAGASASSPKNALGDALPGVGRFSAGVISVTAPDGYSRVVTIRCVGWIDSNGNGQIDAGEAKKTVDVSATYQLARSQVFDYAYFVNNYGWMDGFGVNDLIVNGDMRANGNFNFTNGSPTVNGSVFACLNEKLSSPAAGLLNTPPVKWDQSTYAANAAATNSGNADNENRWRQSYNAATYGAQGTSMYETWRDLVFESTGNISNNRLSGAVVGDSSGTSSWNRTAVGNTATKTILDSNPTQEVIMPDLSNLSYYQNLSSTYVDSKRNYADGTANPNYGTGAYIQVWNTTTNSYQTLTTNGNISGSAVMVGTAAHPIIIHGPVTVSQDILIKGTIKGQGTIYTGRNVHVVGSIVYQNKPNFKGSNPTTIDNANEKADLLALAARGSVIMGKTTDFTDSSPLNYMTPPFTKGRYDENGNWIPPFNAKEVDSTGRMRYQTVLPDSTMNSVAEGVTQLDAVLYTNFLGGGNVGVGGSGIKFNGSIISKDEAMVAYSLPMRMNYDSRIRERTLTSQPLIDIQLPRSPVMLRSAWKDQGFVYGVGDTLPSTGTART